MKYEDNLYLSVLEKFKPLTESLIYKYKNILFVEADDVRQEIAIKVMEVIDSKYESFNDETRLMRYLNGCIKNTVMDIIRKNARCRLDLLYDDMIHIDALQTHVPKPLKELLDGLNDEEKRIAILYIHGLNQNEIGKMLSMSQPSVSIKLSKIRKKIQQNI